MADDFPTEVRQFIDRNIESVAQLEALLLLRTDPQRTWNAEDIGKALYIPSELATTLLLDFNRRGFVELAPSAVGCYRYASSAHELDQLIADVIAAYQNRRVAIISLIYSKPLNKVQTFADAFRLRTEDPQ